MSDLAGQAYRALTEGDPKAAMQTANKALEANPTDVVVLLVHGQAQLVLADLPENQIAKGR